MGTTEPLTTAAKGPVPAWIHRTVRTEVRVPPAAGGTPPALRRTPPRLTPRHYEVLQAVADGRICRGWLLGDLEPYLLDGRDVIGDLRRLVLRRLVLLHHAGPPSLTRRGRWVLNASD